MWGVICLCVLLSAEQSSVETRIAVMDARILGIYEDIQELKASSATKTEIQNIQSTLVEMKALLNPRMVKIDQMEVWKANHVLEHSQASARLSNTIMLSFAFFTVVIAGLQFIFERVRRHTDNHHVDTSGG